MTRLLLLASLLCCIVWLGCREENKRTGSGDSDADGDTDSDADGDSDSDSDTDFRDNGCTGSVGGGMVRLTGRVMGPGGLFPVARALVAAYADSSQIPQIPDGAYCEECVDITGIAAELTSPDGAFCLDVSAGSTIFLAAQKGQFRRVREYSVPSTPGEEVVVDQNLVTLPSSKDDTLGDMIPSIALALGDYDAVEDILGKAGIGEVDVGYSWIEESENAEFRYDIYDNKMPGGMFDQNYGENLDNLILDLNRMLQYHIIFFPCSYNANWEFMIDQAVIDNMRDYVWAGGYTSRITVITWRTCRGPSSSSLPKKERRVAKRRARPDATTGLHSIRLGPSTTRSCTSGSA